jgi:hypothetical protein
MQSCRNCGTIPEISCRELGICFRMISATDETGVQQFLNTSLCYRCANLLRRFSTTL